MDIKCWGAEWFNNNNVTPGQFNGDVLTQEQCLRTIHIPLFTTGVVWGYETDVNSREKLVFSARFHLVDDLWDGYQIWTISPSLVGDFSIQKEKGRPNMRSNKAHSVPGAGAFK